MEQFLTINIFKIFKKKIICGCVWLCAHEYSASRGQKTSGPLDITGGYEQPTLVLGTKL